MRPRAINTERDWEVFDAWFRHELINELKFSEFEAEKSSRFILSLFMRQDEVDYERERDLFKYRKKRLVYFVDRTVNRTNAFL